DLCYFLAIARSGKLTVAARRLEVEHSTVSRRLAALEQALGARLFDREPDGYRLTSAGEKLLPSAEGMEALALTSQSHLADTDMTVSGS
ncbi:LysR family transcriptional regulator, partial [Acinetobacter baumannii]|uniref:LysR family transcriptional regulator n=1 Tax=Acinetobacter baumannii TaxID=470 RepID=UPI0013D61BF3